MVAQVQSPERQTKNYPHQSLTTNLPQELHGPSTPPHVSRPCGRHLSEKVSGNGLHLAPDCKWGQMNNSCNNQCPRPHSDLSAMLPRFNTIFRYALIYAPSTFHKSTFISLYSFPINFPVFDQVFKPYGTSFLLRLIHLLHRHSLGRRLALQTPPFILQIHTRP